MRHHGPPNFHWYIFNGEWFNISFYNPITYQPLKKIKKNTNLHANNNSIKNIIPSHTVKYAKIISFNKTRWKFLFKNLVIRFLYKNTVSNWSGLVKGLGPLGLCMYITFREQRDIQTVYNNTYPTTRTIHGSTFLADPRHYPEDAMKQKAPYCTPWV